MKLYKITIKPTSNFATPLKGDTIFGQLCWIIRYKYKENRLEELLSCYDTEPFLIVSDAFAKDYLPKPSIPQTYLGENLELKKQNHKRIWLSQKDLFEGNYTNAKTDEDVQNHDKTIVSVKNSINYKTFTTDSVNFAPFSEVEYSISSKDIYCLISSAFSQDELKECFRLLGEYGYGKNTSIGKGRFEILDFQEVTLNNKSTTFIALSAFAPTCEDYKHIFYEPFTRFGKHSQGKDIKNAFKKPILLADCGGVVEFKEEKSIQYIGQCIKNHSSFKKAVHQGYSMVLPLKELKNV